MRVKADICRQCAEEHLMSLIRFYPTAEYRQRQQLEERRQKYPDEAPLKSLRMTVPAGLEDVACDICETPCFDKHLNLRPRWLDANGIPIEAVVCELCTATYLLSVRKLFREKNIFSTIECGIQTL